MRRQKALSDRSERGKKGFMELSVCPCPCVGGCSVSCMGMLRRNDVDMLDEEMMLLFFRHDYCLSSGYRFYCLYSMARGGTEGGGG